MDLEFETRNSGIRLRHSALGTRESGIVNQDSVIGFGIRDPDSAVGIESRNSSLGM